MQRYWKKRGHDHRHLFDFNSGKEICLCGHVKGESGRPRISSTRTEYNGRKYHSKKEAEYAGILDAQLRARQIKSWRPQVRIPIFLNGERVCFYVVDFEVIHHGGLKEWVEVKGWETEIYILKAKLLRAQYKEELAAGTLKYSIVKKAATEAASYPQNENTK